VIDTDETPPPKEENGGSYGRTSTVHASRSRSEDRQTLLGDEAFRKEFASDPAGTFTKYLDVPAERLPKITVYQEETGTWHIVLPPKPANASELSEEELEKVAGGVSPVIATVSATVATVAVSGAIATATLDSGW
jgi:lactobin A/cerein 7B family class IIb bacteriocin